MPEAADSGLDDVQKENNSMLPSSAGKRKKAVAGGAVLMVSENRCILMTTYLNNIEVLQAEGSGGPWGTSSEFASVIHMLHY